MLTRTARRILDHNIASLVRMDPDYPQVLEELVCDLHEHPQLVTEELLCHRFFDELVYGVLRIMDANTPKQPRIAGNASYVLGALLDSPEAKMKVIFCLKDEKRLADTQHTLPLLAALIETYDLDAMTNASGTASLICENEECLEWVLDQPSCEWLTFVLSKSLINTDMWVASNCALAIARMCMNKNGNEKILHTKYFDEVITYLIEAVGVDNEGRGMNAAFALAYLCDTEEGLLKISAYKEFLDLILGLINMLRSVDEGCRKNAAFCLKAISQWEEGAKKLNDDPDIFELLKLLSNLLTCGDEDLGKMASNILTNLAQTKEGYMLQKESNAKTALKHVLSQMDISDSYRAEAFGAMKTLMIDKPEPPQLKVIDSQSIDCAWESQQAKSGSEVHFELFMGDEVVYTGPETSFKAKGLKEKTEYEFRLRAFTDKGEESFVSDGAIIQTFRAVSSPPKNARATQVTSSQIRIVWERPAKVCGNLRGYFVQETGSAIHYEPVNNYHVASNLEADKEYTFEICAVTQRGHGEVSEVTVRTLKNDYYAPSKPKLKVNGSQEIIVTWEAPVVPSGRINGYEAMCNGKSIYFGMDKRCVAKNLQQETEYKFTVVAWTNEGRTESQPTMKKTGSGYKKKTPKDNELQQWLDSKEEEEEAVEKSKNDSAEEEDADDAEGNERDEESEEENEESEEENEESEGEGEESDENEDDEEQCQNEEICQQRQ